MMINKRLINTVKESKKYIAGNVICQWISLCANIAMMCAIAGLFQSLYEGTQSRIAGIWGQRRHRYLQEHNHGRLTNLMESVFLSCKMKLFVRMQGIVDRNTVAGYSGADHHKTRWVNERSIVHESS